MNKEMLASKLSVILSDVVTFKSASQGFHWNVKGPQFIQFHDFFGELYEDAESAIDPLGENIRKLGFDAPVTLSDYVSMASMEPNPTSSDPIDQSRELYNLNANLIRCLVEAFAMAEELNEQGIADFIAGRIDIHNKYQWQLGTIIGADKTSISEISMETESYDATSEYMSDFQSK
jgi:starvation-inducible DNA-binding protein